MTKDFFESLSLDQKTSIVWERTQFLDNVDYHNCKVILRNYGKQFVEVYYDMTENEIIKITVAEDNDLDKFLDRIKLPI